MKVAALDLGTNTFLCLVAEVENGIIKKVIEDHVQVVRLGQNVAQTKTFQPQALVRAQNCLTNFAKVIQENNPDAVLAMATSAARDVENSQELFNIGKKLNIPIEIIPGNKEAEITYLGAISGLPTKEQTIVVIDVGGGSTELIVGKGKNILFSTSLDIGCVRLTETLISQQPIQAKELNQLRIFIKTAIKKTVKKIAESGPVSSLLAVAGTPTELARIEIGEFDVKKIDGYKFSLGRLEHWVTEFAKLTPAEIIKKFNVNPGRADVILSGTIILSEICKELGQSEIEVSTRGVRFGVALELESRLRKQK